MKKIRWIYLLPAVAGAVLMTVTSCKDTEGTNDASGTFEATEVMVSSEASKYQLVHWWQGYILQ